MTKLLAVLALSLMFSACKKDEDNAPATPAPAAASGTAPATPTGLAPVDVPADKLPAACAKFKALAERLGACEKLPADVRQGIRSSWAMMTRSLKMSTDDQTANCTKATDALATLEQDCP